jgi:hypothetical protein
MERHRNIHVPTQFEALTNHSANRLSSPRQYVLRNFPKKHYFHCFNIHHELCEIWGCHSGVAVDSGLLGCECRWVFLDVSDLQVSNSQEEQPSLNRSCDRVLWENCRKRGMMSSSLHRRRKVMELRSLASLIRRFWNLQTRLWTAALLRIHVLKLVFPDVSKERSAFMRKAPSSLSPVLAVLRGLLDPKRLWY